MLYSIKGKRLLRKGIFAMLGFLYKDFYTAKKELLLTGFMALLFVGYNLIIGRKEMLGPSIGVLVPVGTWCPPIPSIMTRPTTGTNLCAPRPSAGRR